MSFTKTAKFKRLRGVIIELLRDNHDSQQSRLDSVALWSAMVRGLGFDASRNDVLTCLQDLSGRGYVKFDVRRDLDTGIVRLVCIELCPKGRDLLEGTTEDPAVEL